MATARKASVTKSKLAMLLFGEPFTGKSTMASQLGYFKHPDGKPFKVLYLDPESGSIDDMLEDLGNNAVDLNNIYIVYTQSLKEVREYIRKAKDNEDIYELDEEGNETDVVVMDGEGNPFRPDAIVVDGTSILNLTTKQGLIEFSKKRAKVKADRDGLIGDEKFVKVEGSGLELKDYQAINFKGQDLILDLMGSGKHFIVTAREIDEKETKIVNGKEVTASTGRKIADGFKGMDYNVKTVIRMFREDGIVKAEVRKDRTKVHEDCTILEDPTLIDWQAVIDRGATRQDFVIQNNLTKAVETEHKIWKSEALGDEPEKKDVPVESSEVEELRSQIDTKLTKMSPVKKKALQEKAKTEGFSTNYKTLTDVEFLKKLWDFINQ